MRRERERERGKPDRHRQDICEGRVERVFHNTL